MSFACWKDLTPHELIFFSTRAKTAPATKVWVLPQHREEQLCMAQLCRIWMEASWGQRCSRRCSFVRTKKSFPNSEDMFSTCLNVFTSLSGTSRPFWYLKCVLRTFAVAVFGSHSNRIHLRPHSFQFAFGCVGVPQCTNLSSQITLQHGVGESNSYSRVASGLKARVKVTGKWRYTTQAVFRLNWLQAQKL